jgi:uncharacterized SAM-binding protein YcdF (DUF218 family)
MVNATPPNNSKITSCIQTLILFFLINFLFFIFIWVGLVGAGSYLIVKDRVKPIDAIVVLSGDEGERVKEAVKWYEKGYANNFVITKTHTEYIGEGRTYSEKLQRMAIDAGVPADSIFITDGEASTTAEEAQAVKILANQRNIHSILVITAPYHTRRARIIFNQEFKNTDMKILVHPVEDSWYKPINWYLSAQGWRQTFTEYGSLLVIWFKS